MYKYLDFNKLAAPSEAQKRMAENVVVLPGAYLGGASIGAVAGQLASAGTADAVEYALNRRVNTVAENYLSRLYGPEFVPNIKNRTKVLDEALRGAGITGFGTTPREIARKLPGEAELSNAARLFHNWHGTSEQRSAARKLFNVADARLARMEAVDPKTVMRAGGVGGGILGAAALGEFVRRKVRDRRAAE